MVRPTRSGAGDVVRRLAERVNEGVGHPIMFVVASLQTIIWTVIVLKTHYDRHGFWFLYMATAVSYVTQFTLTLVGLSAKKEAMRAAASAEEGAQERRQLLIESARAAETHRRMLIQLQRSDASLETVLEGLAVSLATQQHMTETVIEISRRDLEMAERIEDMVERLTGIAEQATKRHEDNQKLIRRTLRATRPLTEAAIEAALEGDADEGGLGERDGAGDPPR